MSDAFEPVQPVLEPAAAAFAEATANPPYLFDLPPAEGRKAVDEVQSGEIERPAVDEEWITVPGGPTGSVRARIVKPAGASGTLPVIIYIHGAGWVFGNAHTHDRLVRELAVGANAAVVFPEYDLSPEAPYPVAIEQNFAVAKWVVEEGASKGLDGSRLAVAGDSVGGNMTAALTLMAKERGGIPLLQQVLFYPVTDASFDTPSYHQFATGYFLRRDGMFWFWDQYTTDENERAQITASPLGDAALRPAEQQDRSLPGATRGRQKQLPAQLVLGHRQRLVLHSLNGPRTGQGALREGAAAGHDGQAHPKGGGLLRVARLERARVRISL
jgi:acetyl esterase/lipase